MSFIVVPSMLVYWYGLVVGYYKKKVDIFEKFIVKNRIKFFLKGFLTILTYHKLCYMLLYLHGIPSIHVRFQEKLLQLVIFVRKNKLL